VSSTPDDARTGASRLGFASGQVVQEFGYDDDVERRAAWRVETLTGSPLVDDEYDDVTDGAIIWFRDGDGDLTTPWWTR